MTELTPARPTPAVPPRRALSLEHKLPLLMTAVLAAVLGSSLLLTHRTLTRAAEEAARERMRGAAQQIGTAIDNNTAARARLLRRAAASAPVRAALRGDAVPVAAVDAMLDTLRAPADSGLPVELWSADGRRIHASGTDVAAGPMRPQLRESLDEPTGGRREEGVLRPDSVFLGKFAVVGGRIFFWTSVPVVDDGRIIGYIVQQRRIGRRGAAADTVRDATTLLRGLMGDEITLFLRNADDDVWLTAQGYAVAPPAARDTSAAAPVHEWPDVGPSLAVVHRVAGTPWGFALELPLRSVHEGPRRTVERLAAISAALMFAGSLLAWWIGRRVARPITSLTVAAEAIARGDYDRRVRLTRGDEIGRLASSFNTMAGEIDHGRRELEHRMEDADRARDEAEAANRAKSDFLATMSHELRTPLNAIGGYADLLALGIYGPVTDAQSDALTRITRNQAHLLRLINDVLHFAKLSVGQLTYSFAPVDLDDALAELDVLVAPQMSAKQLRFTHTPCAAPILVRADREKLQQIVLNLLSNAIKFTSEAGAIVVECERGDGVARVHVRDTGMGIPAARLASVFDAFVQVDRALNRPNEGVGLGLAISRDLATAMGGDLTVQSELDRGTTFTLTLPLWRADDVSRKATPAAGVPLAGRR